MIATPMKHPTQCAEISTAACASGHYSIVEGYHFLRRGEADVIIAGGAESLMSMLTMAAFGRMGPLSTRTDDPEHACRPFSVDRDGFVARFGGIFEQAESLRLVESKRVLIDSYTIEADISVPGFRRLLDRIITRDSGRSSCSIFSSCSHSLSGVNCRASESNSTLGGR